MATYHDLSSLAKALGGEVSAGQILAPGPGHSADDRSLSIKLDSAAPEGFLVHSFAGDDPARCRAHVREKLGLPDLQPKKSGNGKAWSPVRASYIYRDRNGAPYLRVQRTATKQFFQQHWDGANWIKGKPQGPKVPYRLPELLAADPTTPVYICEGEKDADNLAKLGFLATCNSGGADPGNGSKWTAELNTYFKDRHVYILPDNDAPGRQHAQHVAHSLYSVAASVRIIDLPGLPPKGDVTDWLKTDPSAARLMEACERAPLFEPAGGASESGDDAEILRLAKLGELEYEHARKGAAERLNVRASILDRLVAAAREKFNPDESKQGRALSLPEPERWPDPVDGAALLEDLSATIRQHVVMADASADVVALWCVYNHAANAFSIAPRLAITSPVKGCGKTTLMDCIACLVWRPLQAASITPASIFRAVEMARPTLLFDEAERMFAVGGDNDMLAILNSGHREGGGALRLVGDDHEPRWFSTFAPAAFALIGRLPDTQEDRSIAVELRRRTADEPLTRFRLDRTHHLHALARRAARWVADNIDSLRVADPDMGALFNRVADNWRPLFAVADLAGGNWPRRARDAAAVAVARDSESSTGEQLLADIQIIFAQKGVDRVPSGDLAAALAQLEGRPWAEWGRAGKPITANALARQLKKFKTGNDTPIASVDIWTGDRNLKGYLLSQFDDAFRHYLAPEGGFQPRNREEPTATGTSTTFATARTEPDLAVGKCEKPNNDGYSRGCAVGNPGSAHTANGRRAPNCLCDHCGQPGRPPEPLNRWDWQGRREGIWLHVRCEQPWFDGEAPARADNGVSR
jgi:predicted DNA-binding protein (UPF0251 family)